MPALLPVVCVCAGLDYLYGLLHDRLPHSGENCSRWVWYDNCRNLAAAPARVVKWCKDNCDSGPCPNTLNPNFVSKPVRAEDQATKPSKLRKAEMARVKG